MNEILLILVLFQIKHWYVDFVIQTTAQVNSKGKYGDLLGIIHSVEHGVYTFAVLSGVASLYVALIIGLFDIIIHYHIDWIKMNYGNRDINDPKFWNHLGLDQMIHQICYIGYASVLLFY